MRAHGGCEDATLQDIEHLAQLGPDVVHLRDSYMCAPLALLRPRSC